MIDIKLSEEFEVQCEVCKNTLTAEAGSFTIIVTPCQFCLDDSYTDGYSKGKDECE